MSPLPPPAVSYFAPFLTVMHLHMPAQPLVKALFAICEASGNFSCDWGGLPSWGMQLIVPAIDGNFTINEALQRVLQGTPFKYTYGGPKGEPPNWLYIGVWECAPDDPNPPTPPC